MEILLFGAAAFGGFVLGTIVTISIGYIIYRKIKKILGNIFKKLTGE